MTPFVIVCVLAIAMANDHKVIIKDTRSVIHHVVHAVKRIK